MRGGERKSGPRQEMSAAVRRAAGEILWLEGWGNLLEGEGKPFRGNAPGWGTYEGDRKRAEGVPPGTQGGEKEGGEDLGKRRRTCHEFEICWSHKNQNEPLCSTLLLYYLIGQNIEFKIFTIISAGMHLPGVLGLG